MPVENLYISLPAGVLTRLGILAILPASSHIVRLLIQQHGRRSWLWLADYQD